MILSTHRSAQTEQHPRASFWPIALIIIISALLAVFVEPMFPNPVVAAHADVAQTADDRQ
jgi:hypothetical protein